MDEQKERFFKSNFTATPKFKYRPIKFNPYELKKQLHLLETDQIEDITIRHLYESVITGCIDQINMVAAKEEPRSFIFNSLRYFGRPDAKDIRNAKYILLLPEKERQKNQTVWGG